MEAFSGLLNYFADFSPLLRTLMWMLTALMNMHSAASSRDRRFQLPAQLSGVLQAIVASDLSVRVCFATPRVLQSLTVDASDTGWGAFWEGPSISGMWTFHKVNQCQGVSSRPPYAPPLAPTASQKCHQDLLGQRGGSHHKEKRFGEVVPPVQDSGADRTPMLSPQDHTPSSSCGRELKHVADSLSRSSPHSSEWSFYQDVFQEICSWWGLPQVDLCATPLNNKTETFISPLPTAEIQDCLSTSWDQWDLLYVFPPNKNAYIIPEINGHGSCLGL